MRRRRWLGVYAVVAAAATVLIPVSASGGASEPDDVLSRAAQVLTADIQELRAAGIDVQTVVTDEAHDQLRVGLRPNSNPDSAAILQERVPDVTVTVSYVRVHAAAGVSDYAAGPPWEAGMELYSTFSRGGRLYYRECTAGFNVVNPSTGRTYVTTAGHCFAPGSVVMHSVRYAGQRVGVVTARAGYGTSADTELVSAAQGSLRNTVITDGQTRRTVRSYRPVTGVGMSVCKSGIATGETCGNVVRDSSVTVCYPREGCVHGQEQTYNPRLARVASYGDSGGPVYTYGPNGTVIAAGTVSGFGESCNARGTNCHYNGVMFFTPIKNMKATLGVVP